MATKHALLSASSSDRWIHCPPSARLSETYEDKGSDYAAEGTDAHSLCEYKLKTALGMEADDPTENLGWFNQEIDDCASGYAAYVLEQVEAAKETCSDPVVLIEQHVDFSRWVEEGFGTADCIIIADGTLQVIDFKLPPLLTDEDVEDILGKIDDLISWASDIKEYALSQAISGKEWSGFKLVEGRSNRRYVNDTAVATAVTEAGFDPYEQKLLGITAMQKLLGKARFDEVLSGLVEKPQGKPTLVPESDKRPAMNTAITDFKDNGGK